MLHSPCLEFSRGTAEWKNGSWACWCECLVCGDNLNCNYWTCHVKNDILKQLKDDLKVFIFLSFMLFGKFTWQYDLFPVWSQNQTFTFWIMSCYVMWFPILCFFTHLHTSPVQSASNMALFYPLSRSPAMLHSYIIWHKNQYAVWRWQVRSREKFNLRLISPTTGILAMFKSPSIQIHIMCHCEAEKLSSFFLCFPRKPSGVQWLNDSVDHSLTVTELAKAGCLFILFSLLFLTEVLGFCGLSALNWTELPCYEFVYETPGKPEVDYFVNSTELKWTDNQENSKWSICVSLKSEVNIWT